MSSSVNSSKLPSHPYGLFDIGGQDYIVNAGRTGWLVDAVDVNSQTGIDYSALTKTGVGVIVRLSNSHGGGGTIPTSYAYDTFAAQCAAYVKNSPGASIWLIGNEMNASAERPAFPDGIREMITPQKYVECFRKCRNAIKSLAGHAGDLVIPGAVAPYNAETGDWVSYLVEILNLLENQVDGIALECHTHDYSIDQIASDDMMGAPFNTRHFNFRAYRDFLNALPAAFRALPVFITATNPYAGWKDANIGWIKAAYQEINAWNSDPAHQPIQALVLSRWQLFPDHPELSLQDKTALLADFRAALAADYRIRWASAPPPAPTPPPAPPAPPEYRVKWNAPTPVPTNSMVAGSTTNITLEVTNHGSKPWPARGANPVRLGYHWYNALGIETPVAPYAGNFSTPRDVVPGEAGRFENVELRAPQTPGAFTLKWDMVQEGITWFSARGSATLDYIINIEPPPPSPLPPSQPTWQVKFLAHDTPVSERAGQTIMVNLKLKNTGTNEWLQSGTPPVHIGYKWFDASGQQKLDVEDRRTALPIDVLPGDDIALGAILAIPKTPGNYDLHWDLVAEGNAWFADGGGEPLVIPCMVTALPVDVSGWRAEANVNPIPVARALNGDPRTGWDSGVPQSPEQWFRLNLGGPRMIDGVQFLSPGKGFPAGYTLRVSAQGSDWIEVARIAANNANDVMAIFAPQPVQYLQIDLLSPAPTSWMISEIIVHSAAGWFARASHNDPEANQAIDNQPTTAWSSGTPQTPGMWFQIDLGRVELVSGVALDAPLTESPVDFRITTWDAATSGWLVACEVKDNHAPIDIVFASRHTQFINIQLLSASDQPWTIHHAHVVREMDTWLGPMTAR